MVYQFDYISFELVVGNYDIFILEVYQVVCLKVYEEFYVVGLFLLLYYFMDEVLEGCCNFVGYIYLGVVLEGMGW